MRFTYTIRPTHKRTFLLASEVAGMPARAYATGGWRTFYLNHLRPTAVSLLSQSDASIALDQNNANRKLLAILAYALAEGDAAARAKCVSVANHFADYNDWIASDDSVHMKRGGATLLASVYDLLFDEAEMSTGSKTKIRGAINHIAEQLKNTPYTTPSEKISGHSGANMAHLFLCGAAICTEDALGFGYIQTALDYFFGANAGDEGSLELDRIYGEDGACARGPGYAYIRAWDVYLFSHWFNNAFLRNSESSGALLLDGTPYDYYQEETWIQRQAEFFLRLQGAVGNQDYITWDDTIRISAPRYTEQQHVTFAFLGAHGGSWRPVMHWMYDRLIAAGLAGGDAAYYLGLDMILWPKEDPACAPLSPVAAAVPKTHFFQQMGYHAILPQWTPGSACDITIKLPQMNYRNHCHMNIGCIDIGVDDDRVLLDTGIYNTSDPLADLEAPHNNRWHKQAISKSGTPLCEAGIVADDENWNWSNLGPRTRYTNANGGQNWKSVGGFTNGLWNPAGIRALFNDGGGNAWRMCTSHFEPASDDTADFLWADLRHAYLRELTDLGTVRERLPYIHVRLLVIKNEGPWPVIFRVVHWRSRLPEMKKRDHWNFATAPIVDFATRRIRALGFKRTGAVTIDYYQPNAYLYETIGGPVSSSMLGANCFYYPSPPNGTNWPPSSVPVRCQPWVGQYRVEVRSAFNVIEHWFVNAIFPHRASEQPVAYAWEEEAEAFVMNFGGRKYRISKTLDQASWPSSGPPPPDPPDPPTPDTQPPGPPQNPRASEGAASGEIVLACDPRTDDTVAYRGYYRLLT